MRTLVLALLIALLPIRGWLGDAMAIEMVRHSLPAAASVAMAASSGGTADAHCHDAMDAANGMDMGMDVANHTASHDGGPGNSGTDHQGCDTCTACQVCHTVALGGMPAVDTVHSAPQPPPAAHAARFASAEPAPGLKPPIS